MFIILGQLVVLAGCPSNLETNDNTNGNNSNNIQQQGNKVWYSENWSLFNTKSIIRSFKGDSEDNFKKYSNIAYNLLGQYHKLFDIYNSGIEKYDVVNLYDINANAGGEPMVVDQKLIDFLLYAKEIHTKTLGETNVMLGAVLELWHDAREKKNYVPGLEELQEANKHTSIDLLEIDDENNTVRISDPLASIDVGALGKGYATEKVAQYLETQGCTSYVLDIGGNIRIIGTKPDETGWTLGIKHPRNEYSYIIKTNIKDTSCVTSGDYERYYFYEGTRYHHIIDKDTLMPSDYFVSITIFVKDSGLADALSTALFCMSYEDGKKLVESFGGIEVVWVDKDLNVTYTDGFKPIE